MHWRDLHVVRRAHINHLQPMPWTNAELSEPPVIETTYTGMVSPKELVEAVKATTDWAASTGKHQLLGDCRELTGGHSLFDLYAVVEELDRAGLGRNLREAILVPGTTMPAEMTRFWETACCNRGLKVRVFSDRAEALKWLEAD